MSKNFKRVIGVMLATLILGIVAVPVSKVDAALINPGDEVFQVIVTDSTDGTTAVLKDTNKRKAGDVFKITDAKVKAKVGNGYTMIVTKQVNKKTGKLSYKYMAGKERITLGFVKDANTVIDGTGKTFTYANDFGAGSIVEIVYDSKFTHEISDDVFKEARLLGSVK